jgi:hypothetical protein
MEEIKIRLFDEENGKMHYNIGMDVGSYLCYGDFSNKLLPPPFIKSIGKDCDGIHVMLFIGIKDKVGKEIYEGDIIKHDIIGIIGSVIFDMGCFRIDGDNNDIYIGHAQLPKIKVIGNIYENPEYNRNNK